MLLIKPIVNCEIDMTNSVSSSSNVVSPRGVSTFGIGGEKISEALLKNASIVHSLNEYGFSQDVIGDARRGNSDRFLRELVRLMQYARAFFQCFQEEELSVVPRLSSPEGVAKFLEGLTCRSVCCLSSAISFVDKSSIEKRAQDIISWSQSPASSSKTELALDDVSLCIIPSVVSYFKNVKIFSCRNNKLLYVSPLLSKMRSLTKLDLSGNNLSELPPEVSSLSALRVVDLSNNKFCQFPKSICSQTFLISLNLSQNFLRKIPEYVIHMRFLEVMDLSANRLDEITTKINGLFSLQKLILTNNRLSTLPDSLSRCMSLKWISISTNNFRELPSTMMLPASLEYFDASYNEISHIPYNFAQLYCRNMLKLEKNPCDPHANDSESQQSSISSLEDAFQKLHCGSKGVDSGDSQKH
jgi:Leucine-rich repeat (LRR) protein